MTEPGGTRAPLEHLRVVDLTTEMGALTVRMLTGFGAAVTRIEPPGGDPLRSWPPLTPGADGKPVSLYWLQMMDGRTMVPLDLASIQGREHFFDLLADADVVVESQPRGRLAELGLDYGDVAARFPRLIWTSVSAFGRTGPLAGYKGTDLTGLASGGLLSLCGDPDRAPVRPSVEQGYAQVGLQALAGTMAAIHARNATGRGQLVDVSMQEAVATCLGNARLFYEFEGVVSKRAGGARAYGAHGSRLVYPCADGFVAFARTPDALRPLWDWMHESGMEPGFDPEEWAKLPQSGPGTPGPEKARELEGSVISFFATRGKMALYEEGQQRGIMICPASSPADLLVNAQLLHREWFEEPFLEQLGRTVRVPGAPARFSATPWKKTGSPRNQEAPRRLPAGVPAAASTTTDSRQILRGLRVADFSWVGVGPLSTQVLAWLGAEVVRVESATRLDVFRTGGPQRGEYPDASAYWANCNRDKLGMTLNLKHARAREMALRLAARSDVLVESFTPGFMDSVGLSYDDIRAVNPDIVMMSCSMEGAGGPHALFRGFGLVLQATVGFTHFTSWPDRAPTGTGVAYTDWVATHIAAASMLAALEHKRLTGEGQYIDLSQLEACSWALDAEVLRYTSTGELRSALGNRHESMSPHGVYPVAGDDRWVALAVACDEEWQALTALVGDSALLAPTLSHVAGRKASEDAVDASIADWTRGQDESALVERLQAAGIAAYGVADMADIQDDKQIRARGHYWPTRHPVIGDVDWNGPSWHLSETPLYPSRPAPTLGQHNEHVYRQLLGYGDDEVAELVASGVME
ncbi:MAG: CoA transferase [Dehalococcoidia bacterium]|nr:CoA transferase [Dehalococcoidia bacterium]MCB9484521.1 CoA transferase [Thermoflexaceae bacterium]